MTSQSDWKNDEKLQAALRSLVATNLKHKEIFSLAYRHFRIMNGVYEQLIVGFDILKFFVLSKIHK